MSFVDTVSVTFRISLVESGKRMLPDYDLMYRMESEIDEVAKKKGGRYRDATYGGLGRIVRFDIPAKRVREFRHAVRQLSFIAPDDNNCEPYVNAPGAVQFVQQDVG